MVNVLTFIDISPSPVPVIIIYCLTRFLRDENYPEEETVVYVDPKAEHMTAIARKYQFWLKCKPMNLSELLQVYTIDDDTQIEEALEECSLMEMKEAVEKAEKIIKKMKDKMEGVLETKFDQFKDELKKEYGNKGEKLK